MTKLSFLLLPSLSLIALTTSIAPDPPSTTTNIPPRNNPKLSPRVPSHHPCDCYVVSGPDAGYFTSYKFWDFRNISLPIHDLDPDLDNDPDLDLDLDLEEPEFSISSADIWETQTVPLSESSFSTDWAAQSWSRQKTSDSLVPMVNSDTNAFFARHPDWHGTSQLVLRTMRLQDSSSTAEIESHHGNFFHCSLRVRMRLMSRDTVSRAPWDTREVDNVVPRGACAGIFTYRSATCESDVEFLTSDAPNTIHYANQPDYDAVNDFIIPGASKVVTTVPAPWSSWVTHRMDWLKKETRWYADGQLQANLTISVPDRPSILALNLWTDGGIWTGDMEVDESVYMGIEWIEIAYNTSTEDLSSIEGNQRYRHRPSKRGEKRAGEKRQTSGEDAGDRISPL
ncbi:concanavalin A-like lectin/glucanase domain-containing protein [Aspergillus karnatakaensis]|uniref:glycoside hydrolase family 16 protein n=1 Tax=Aspergillus karnatakaensis TaxID=1810916 RepID=UPI003CCCF077